MSVGPRPICDEEPSATGTWLVSMSSCGRLLVCADAQGEPTISKQASNKYCDNHRRVLAGVIVAVASA